MHKDETWQIYRPNGEPIVGAGWPAEKGNPEETENDAIVGLAIVFLYRINDEGELELLWQKRSEQIDRYPGDFDISAGGHINLGESVIEAAKREAFEEIGAKIAAEDLNLVALPAFNKNRLAWLFMVDYTGREEDFSFRDAEVSEVRWVAWKDTDEFRKEFAKAPLKKADTTFGFIGEWFGQRGII